ncbi:hypothetical protein OG738_03760 [Amycolatopsis sp. NBC_01488]|uniref:hypothetical protein n=1 Tax=Amycolatopsis sp. NBC_01488 TaxID=2903563 RepID=UPI002E2A33BF|nr:hypothetical protein [Amycolatopsis sp. NBC_01488]
MNGLGLAALVVVAVPLIAVAVWVIRELRSAQRRRRFLAKHRNRSVAGIRERVERERAEERAAQADTEVFPVVMPDDVPTTVLPTVRPEPPPVMPQRVRRYVRRPSPRPRKPLPRPETELMQRILDGLKRLD